MVSLASNPRLRKLRFTESEDLVNGSEYTRRLRQQFERLYPVPEWANPSARRKSTQKARRRSSDSSGSIGEDGSASDTSLESDDLSTQPLTKLMRNTTSLLRTTLPTSTGAKKLRPEILDIQRTNDVGITQPVCHTWLRSKF